jgi:Putative phage tail protein
MAQLVVAAAGAAIGGMLAPAGFAFLGMSGAQLGWMAGSMLGSLANKPPSQYGPRLDDSALRVTGTEYGQTIPWVAGAPRLPGQMVWASDRRETATTEEQGKGGGAEYTTYSYDIDVLYVVADRPGCTVTRIWMNGRIVWTTLATSDDESRLASEGTGGLTGGATSVANTGRTERWARLTVYDGREDQLPDPTYEAAVTHAPAYRGRTTVFIEGLQLGNSGALPNFTFEVASDAGESDDIVRRYAVTDIGAANRYRYSQVGGLGVPFIRRMLPTLAVESYAPSPTVGGRRGATIDGEFGAWPSGYSPATLGDWNGWELNLYEATTFSHPVAMIDGQAVRLQRFWHQTATGAGASNIILSIGLTSPTVATGGVDLTAVLPAGLYIGAVFPCTDGEHLLICTAGVTTGGPGQLCDAWWLVKRSGGVTTLADSGTIDMTGSYALSLGTSVYGHGSFTNYSSGCMEDDLEHIWWAYGAGQLHVVMGTIGADGVLRLADSLELGNGIPGGYSTFSATSCWAEAGYCVVVAGGTYSAFRRAGTAIREVPLRRVVEELCDRAGMPAGTYDASALDAITRPVRALAIPQVSSSRATLDMLMTSHAFHAALADKLYFLPRSTTVAANLAWEQLGAGDEQAADDPLEITIGSDLELPARVAVQYRNMAGDQQTGTEYSDRVLDSGQASVQTVQLALGLLPSEAKGVADVVSADTQAALVSAPVSTTLRHAKLWAGSVVQVEAWNGSIYRMRVQRREDAGGVLRFELVADDPQALISQQVTDAEYVVVDTVRSLDGTAFEVLDIPILRDDDDSLGYYVAARSQASGRWPGAVVQASRDGVSFSNVATVAEAGVFGAAATALPAWVGGHVMDEISAVEVSVGAGQLSSVTREQLLSDATANALLIGSEIIRFVSAQLLSTGPNVYRLTRLLRGQRGTEWAMSGHAIGERVVLLRARGMRRVASQASDLAVLQSVRAATLGTVASDAAAEPFTLAGIGAKPFSPVNLRKASDGGGIVLTWERRTRRGVVIRDGVGIQQPLGETVEAYEVEVYDSGNALIESQAVQGVTSATLGAPVLLRSWPRDAADLIEHGGYVYARNTLGSGGVQRYDSARTLVAELADVTTYGDSTTKVARMVHDGAGTAYLLLRPQLTTGGGIAALKVLKLNLATLAVTGSCDVYASAAAAYTNIHFYSGALYLAGSDGAGSTVLARVVASSMAFSTSITITGVGGYAIADDGAGNVCMVANGQYRPYDATTLAAGTPVALGASVYADRLRLVGGVLWGYGTGGIVAIASPAGTLVQQHALSCLDGSPIAVDGAAVIMQERRVLSSPGATTTLSGDLLRFNASTGALLSRVPFADRYLTGIVGSNYVANVVGSGGAYAAAEYGAPGSMSGGRAVVYQISATVGRGYPAEITL